MLQSFLGSSVKNGTLDILRGRVLDPSARVSCHWGYIVYHLSRLLEVPFFTLDPIFVPRLSSYF